MSVRLNVEACALSGSFVGFALNCVTIWPPGRGGLGERLLFPRLTQIVSDFCQNTFAGSLLGRRSVMWCVLVAEIVDKPLAVRAFPSNGIYLTSHVGILQDRGNRGVLVQPTTDRSLPAFTPGRTPLSPCPVTTGQHGRAYRITD